MARVAVLTILLALAPLMCAPGALAACVGVGPARGCADAALDGSSSGFACSAAPGATACVTTLTKSGNGTIENGRVCQLGLGLPTTCQTVTRDEIIGAAPPPPDPSSITPPDPNDLEIPDQDDVNALVAEAVETVGPVVGPVVNFLKTCRLDCPLPL